MNFDTYLPFINLLAFAVNGFLFWKRGTSQATRDLIDLLEKQVQALKEENELSRQRSHDLANQMTVLKGDVGFLKGQLLEREKEIRDFAQIVPQRDGELVKVLAEIKDFMQLMAKKFDDYMYNSHEAEKKKGPRKK